ncbi:hypothetical protein AVEN_249009-1 [Araneus ventricosus]|uniref:Uncharacterized protein n=1 Tax=Araneus ventricosus TaxID=182803 RepID=A0A4Y2JXX2_ARAVE|nr:hypothetical protein AVEN_249009-1 [Araneus ventricosus]
MVLECGAFTLRLELQESYHPFKEGFLLAYRTTPTVPFQVILGIPPLHLQLQLDARITELHRLRNKIQGIPHLSPGVLEHRVTGSNSHPSKHLLLHQISLDDGGSNNLGRF